MGIRGPKKGQPGIGRPKLAESKLKCALRWSPAAIEWLKANRDWIEKQAKQPPKT